MRERRIKIRRKKRKEKRKNKMRLIYRLSKVVCLHTLVDAFIYTVTLPSEIDGLYSPLLTDLQEILPVLSFQKVIMVCLILFENCR